MIAAFLSGRQSNQVHVARSAGRLRAKQDIKEKVREQSYAVLLTVLYRLRYSAYLRLSAVAVASAVAETSRTFLNVSNCPQACLFYLLCINAFVVTQLLPFLHVVYQFSSSRLVFSGSPKFCQLRHHFRNCGMLVICCPPKTLFEITGIQSASSSSFFKARDLPQ